MNLRYLLSLSCCLILCSLLNPPLNAITIKNHDLVQQHEADLLQNLFPNLQTLHSLHEAVKNYATQHPSKTSFIMESFEISAVRNVPNKSFGFVCKHASLPNRILLIRLPSAGTGPYHSDTQLSKLDAKRRVATLIKKYPEQLSSITPFEVKVYPVTHDRAVNPTDAAHILVAPAGPYHHDTLSALSKLPENMVDQLYILIDLLGWKFSPDQLYIDINSMSLIIAAEQLAGWKNEIPYLSEDNFLVLSYYALIRKARAFLGKCALEKYINPDLRRGYARYQATQKILMMLRQVLSKVPSVP